MKRALSIPVLVLIFALATTMAFAQRSTGGSNGHRAGGGHHDQPSAPANNEDNSTNAGSRTHHQHGPKPGARSQGSTPGYVSPFQKETHLVTPGAGCYNCGYGVYGGYVYPGAYPAENVGGTATDAILANGGTFNNINANNNTNPPPNMFDQQYAQQHASDLYIRPEYPTQYEAHIPQNADGSQAASAASESPAILIFKDGQQLKVRNYAIYGAYIVVLTPERKKYPIASLDIAATQKANEEAGYDLKLPAVFVNNR